MRVLGIIPSRYASTRFPGKPLADIGGRSMIRCVYEQCLKSQTLSSVIVATDDQRIADEVESFGGKFVFTSPDHPSGTDRCNEVISNMQETYDAVINIQGDEPFIDPGQIDLLAACFSDPQTQIATLIKKISDQEPLFNPNTPKVIIDAHQFAIYFSRETIPHIRNKERSEWLSGHTFYQHIGIYGYRWDVLKSITGLPVSSLEKAESLEQLRWIENGLKIKTAVSAHQSISIDTPADLTYLLKNLQQYLP